MTVAKKRCLSAGVNIGSITVALYQMLNALPRICGTTGARAVSKSPWRARTKPFSKSRDTGSISFDLDLTWRVNFQIPNPNSQTPGRSQSSSFKTHLRNYAFVLLLVLMEPRRISIFVLQNSTHN